MILNNEIFPFFIDKNDFSFFVNLSGFMQQSMTLMYNSSILEGCKNYKSLLYSSCYPKSYAKVDLFYFLC